MFTLVGAIAGAWPIVIGQACFTQAERAIADTAITRDGRTHARQSGISSVSQILSAAKAGWAFVGVLAFTTAIAVIECVDWSITCDTITTDAYVNAGIDRGYDISGVRCTWTGDHVLNIGNAGIGERADLILHDIASISHRTIRI